MWLKGNAFGEVTEGEWPLAKGKVCRIKIIWRHEFCNERRSRKIITSRRYMNCVPHIPLAEGVPPQSPCPQGIAP